MTGRPITLRKLHRVFQVSGTFGRRTLDFRRRAMRDCKPATANTSFFWMQTIDYCLGLWNRGLDVSESFPIVVSSSVDTNTLIAAAQLSRRSVTWELQAIITGISSM